MKETIYTRVAWRQPFRVTELPALAKVYALSKRRLKSRAATAIWQRGFGVAYRIARRAGVNSTGCFEAQVNGEVRQIRFDSRNTQYCSIYLPHYVQHGYEPETTALLERLLSSGGVFYDVGSNWGHIALHVASAPLGGQVHAFEPMPSTFQDLSSVVQQAGLADRITCHNLALSRDNVTRHMHLPDAVTSGNAEVSSERRGLPIQCVRLDDLDLPRPDVIKVDVEGHEGDVFEGGQAVLAEHRPMIVFESASQHETDRPIRLLRDAGYHFYQPVTLSVDGEACFIHRQHEGQLGDSALGLVEFEMDQRVLLGEHLNILACHDDKRARIQDLFPHTLNEHVRRRCA